MYSLQSLTPTCMLFLWQEVKGQENININEGRKIVGQTRLVLHTRPPTHSPTHVCLRTVLVSPVASWWESRKTCCCFRGCWPVCHLFQGNRRLQEISPVENTHRDNDGKRQQSENVRLKWKPRCRGAIMSFFWMSVLRIACKMMGLIVVLSLQEKERKEEKKEVWDAWKPSSQIRSFLNKHIFS